MVLESGPNEMPLNNFMQFWQDHLPESWRDQVSLKELEVFSSPSTLKIRADLR